MIVLGDLSGIQNYLFDVAEAGGAQARRLRARSFFIQLVAEVAALRVLRTLNWPADEDHFMLSGAGKFTLRGPSQPGIEGRLANEQAGINDWLLREARAELRLTLGWADHEGSDVMAYRSAQQALLQAKARPWGPAPGDGSNPARLVLDPLDTPCSLCGHARAEETESDDETGTTRRVCRWCARTRQLGQRLPQARWLVVREKPQSADLDVLGLGVRVSEGERVSGEPEPVVLVNLKNPESQPAWCPRERFLKRRLMAPVPFENGKLVEFVDLARKACRKDRGDHLLGVLKADVDSLGLAIEEQLKVNSDLRPLAQFSRELDDFFAGRLKAEIETGREPRWRWIYTVFAGGDDLVMVGPWDVMVDFAGRIHQLFEETFRKRRLTLSAGLALIKPKRPIKTAVAEADRLLDLAKTRRAPGESDPKDQVAAFGQVWKWKRHGEIIGKAKQLVGWVGSGEMQRGWLHTLLALAEARHPDVLMEQPGSAKPDLMATARLAHHVARNYRRGTESRRWAEGLIDRFDRQAHFDVRYLPTIVRYALTATRSPGEEE